MKDIFGSLVAQYQGDAQFEAAVNNLPVYDFGRLLDPSHPDFLGTEVLDEAWELVAHQPMRTGFWLFSWGDFDIAVIYSDPDSALGESFFSKIRENNGRWQPMTKAASELFVTGAGGAMGLIAQWEDDVEFIEVESAGIAALNRKRRRKPGTKVFRPRIIHIMESRRAYLRKVSEPKGGTHASPVPHWRRLDARSITATRNGKTYTYWRRAQVVPVNHKGQDAPAPRYIVRP